MCLTIFVKQLSQFFFRETLVSQKNTIKLDTCRLPTSSRLLAWLCIEEKDPKMIPIWRWMLKYKNGRNLTPETIAAIRFVAKVGVMTRAKWYAHFARGNIRWRQMQWKFLIDSKIFRPHPCSIVEDVITLGTYGKKLVRDRGWKEVVSFQPREIHHDEHVGLGLWKLEQAGIIKKWIHQKEIKRHCMDNFRLQLRKKLFKYPDGLLLIDHQDKDEIMVIQYEEKNQGYYKYLAMLKAYQGIPSVHRVLFIVPTKGTKKSIESAMNKIRDGTFSKKIGFIQAEIWNFKPEEYFGRSVPIRVPEAQTSVA